MHQSPHGEVNPGESTWGLCEPTGVQVSPVELELELIQSHMAQKPMLRGEVGARVRVIRACGFPGFKVVPRPKSKSRILAISTKSVVAPPYIDGLVALVITA